jgi:glycosyltransferase involved in cell wall biosynthesis
VRIVFFGTYDAARHPRIGVVRDGLVTAGHEVIEINEPLGMTTAAKVDTLRRPWKVLGFGFRVLRRWLRLWRRGGAAGDPDVAVVGYMGHFDVHLAAWRFRRSLVILDQLVFAADTAADRRIGGGLLRAALLRLDRSAIKRADLVLVDTAETERLIPADLMTPSLVVAVGAPDVWFRAPVPRVMPPMRVLFFGLYTPLQGAPVIGDAIRRLAGSGIEFTMVGGGQDLVAAKEAATDGAITTWLDWIDPVELAGVAASHDVCLGIFGTGDKARRVVPNKVYQGAAAGCAIVTSDTSPQRSAFGDDATFVPCGDAAALARVLEELSHDVARLIEMRERAFRRADREFRPDAIVAPLVRFLETLVD